MYLALIFNFNHTPLACPDITDLYNEAILSLIRISYMMSSLIVHLDQ